MEMLDLPLPSDKNPHQIRAVRGLRLSAISETVDIIDHGDAHKSRTSLRKSYWTRNLYMAWRRIGFQSY